MLMARQCELCTPSAAPSVPEKPAPKPSRLRRIAIEDRVLALCQTHADRVRSIAPNTLSELRLRLAEENGQRSLLDRRAAVDRRAFPARPEGRRGAKSRRASDRSQ